MGRNSEQKRPLKSLHSNHSGTSWTDKKVFILAFLVRLFFILYARIHDYFFNLNFTDVDYEVFTDAALLVYHGDSPYKIGTYRYPPIIAWLLVPNKFFADFGKVIFSSLDVLIGGLQLKYIRQNQHVPETEFLFARRMVLPLWLFNPFNTIIAARGSSDSLICALVLWTLLEVMRGRLVLSAFILGALATHLRIYPLIYLPSVFFHLASFSSTGKFSFGALRVFIFSCLRNKNGFIFILVSLFSFALSTALCWLLYGRPFLEASLIYHFSRVDVRHNFSPYFLPLYLSMHNKELTKFIGILAFGPQALCNLVFAIRFSDDLPFCWFLTTFSFVSFNKVSTSQYFIWYFCFLPLIVTKTNMSLLKSLSLLLLWLFAQAVWLFAAYLLEFQGINTFLFVWFASLLFLAVNCYIILIFVRHYVELKMIREKQEKEFKSE